MSAVRFISIFWNFNYMYAGSSLFTFYTYLTFSLIPFTSS